VDVSNAPDPQAALVKAIEKKDIQNAAVVRDLQTALRADGTTMCVPAPRPECSSQLHNSALGVGSWLDLAYRN